MTLNSFSADLPADLVAELRTVAANRDSGVTSRIEEALRRAISHLTPIERSLVFAKAAAGLNNRGIRKRFGIRTKQALDRRWTSVLRILRLYTLYFACNEHSIALNQLSVLGAAGPILVDIFNAKPMAEICDRHEVTKLEITRAVRIYDRYLEDDLGSGSLKAFVETAVTLYSIKRFD